MNTLVKLKELYDVGNHFSSIFITERTECITCGSKVESEPKGFLKALALDH